MQQKNAEIEKNLIAACLTDHRYLDIALMRGVRWQLFCDVKNAKIWKVMESYRWVPFDMVTIVTEHPEISGNDLLEMIDSFGTANAFDEWVRVFLQSATRTCARRAIQEALASLDKGTDSVEVSSSLNAKLSEAIGISENRKGRTLQEIFDEGINDLCQSNKTVIPWFEPGTEGREKMIHQKGRIVVIAAESGTGKTELTLGCAVKPALENGKRVLYICTESPAGEIACRFAGLLSGLPYTWINRPEKNLSEEMVKYFLDTATKTIPEKYSDLLFIKGSDDFIDTTAKIESTISEITANHGPVDLLVIDFLQDLRPVVELKNDTEYTQITRNMNEIKRITDKYGVATILNCQMNRTDSKRSEKPNKYRLRGSGVIEHKSHVLAFLWKNPENRYLFYSDKTRGINSFEFELTFGRYGYESKGKNDHKYCRPSFNR